MSDDRERQLSGHWTTAPGSTGSGSGSQMPVWLPDRGGCWGLKSLLLAATPEASDAARVAFDALVEMIEGARPRTRMVRADQLHAGMVLADDGKTVAHVGGVGLSIWFDTFPGEGVFHSCDQIVEVLDDGVSS